MAGDTSRENGKLGGRPIGSRSFTTQMREAMINEIRGRTHDVTKNLFNAQLTLAVGMTFLYKIEKEKIVGPKGGISYRSKAPQRVTEIWEIESYLDDVVREQNGESIDEEEGATYYFITTKEPNNQAIDSLLDRTLGTAVKITEISGPGGSPLTTPEVDPAMIKDISKKLNELHRGASVAGYGALARPVDAQIPN